MSGCHQQVGLQFCIFDIKRKKIEIKGNIGLE